MSDEAKLYTSNNSERIVLNFEEDMEDNTLAEATEMAVIEAG